METQNLNTIFDDVFRTISEKMPFLMIPLINEVFHTNYPEDIFFESLRNEHHERSGTIITDSIFKIEDIFYHLECQSKKDGTMAIRMFQYDAAIAIEHAVYTKHGKTHIYFPKSCVLYIRNHSKKRTHHAVDVHFADGQKIVFKCPIIYAQDYTINMIFQKRLLLLLPYHILRYEHFLKNGKDNEKKIQQLLEEYTIIRRQLDQLSEENEKSSLYIDLVNLISRIADYIIPDNNPVKERMEDVMGGKILKLRSEELIEEGMARGVAQGMAQGAENERRNLSIRLQQHGMSIAQIAELVQASPTLIADWLNTANSHS